ncbi:hypothetical protein [Streptomyces filamentosus]|uniref:hypothetical protein n=1 Tax=Streptomyces filamentosus TaxID=67294 RepID=UPI0037D11B92
MSAEAAIRREIERLGVDDIAPGLAALAVDLAAAIDEADAPTAKAVAAREVRALMTELRSLAPIQSEGDALDELQEKRKARRGGAEGKGARSGS